MSETIYLYTPRGYSPGVAYRSYEDAIKQLLRDEGYESLDAIKQQLLDDGWYYTESEGYFSIDDGAEVQSLELR